MLDDLRTRIGRYGFWIGRGKLPDDSSQIGEVGAELDSMGIGALWIGGSPDAHLPEPKALLDGSERLHVGTSIVNIWTADPTDLAETHAEIAERHPGRFTLGLGIGHAPAAEARGLEYVKPYARLVGYLDALDAASRPVPAEERMLSALGPRTLRLASARSAGSVPYLTTPEHTARARALLGGDRLLVPEHAVVIDQDASIGRALGRSFLRSYLALPNYVNTWLSLGFTEDDVESGGSDRLVDAMVLHGPIERVLARLEEHHSAGADHVAVQVLRDRAGVPLEEWREFAAAFAR